MSTFNFKLAHSVKKKDVVEVLGRVGVVIDNVISAPAKHGHAKCSMMIEEIPSGRRFDHKMSGDKRVKLPEVELEMFELMSVDDEGYLSVLSSSGDVRSDLRVDLESWLGKQIVQALEDEENFYEVTVFKTMDIEFVRSIRKAQQ